MRPALIGEDAALIGEGPAAHSVDLLASSSHAWCRQRGAHSCQISHGCQQISHGWCAAALSIRSVWLPGGLLVDFFSLTALCWCQLAFVLWLLLLIDLHTIGVRGVHT